jgi:putative nucleotidyltransferase with HDIG domain
MIPTVDELNFATTSLLVALSARNLETGDHCPRVARLALSLGQLLDLPSRDLENLKLGALLHDIGKIRVPDAILCKPGRLTPAEWGTMKLHPADGGNMLRALNCPAPVVAIVEQHHEWYDGAGYPYGLAGDQICEEARIFAVADAYDALTRDRVYRRGVDHHSALAEWSGDQFDPAVVAALFRLSPTQQAGAA